MTIFSGKLVCQIQISTEIGQKTIFKCFLKRKMAKIMQNNIRTWLQSAFAALGVMHPSYVGLQHPSCCKGLLCNRVRNVLFQQARLQIKVEFRRAENPLKRHKFFKKMHFKYSPHCFGAL